MTFLTVVIILAPMYEDGNGWYIMLFTGSMLYTISSTVLAILSLVLFERLPRCRCGRSGGRWYRRSYTVCMICTAILQEPSTAPTPLCGYTTRPFRRH